MTDAALAASAQLVEELAKPVIDVRTVPVRFSSLKRMSMSPAHYAWSVQNETEQSLAMRIGSGVHAYLLGREQVVVFEGVRRGRAWDLFQEVHTNSVILNQREATESKRIAESVLRHKEASRLLFDGTIIEQRIDWTFAGRAMRSTPDARKRGAVRELKVTKCAEPERLKKQALWMHYHGQLAFYGMADNNSIDIDAHIVAVESAPPHPVTIVRLSPKTLAAGWVLCRGWLERLKVCEEADVWPGYTEAVTTWDIDDDPDWLVFADAEGGES